MKRFLKITVLSLILAAASAVITTVPSADAATPSSAGAASAAREAADAPKPKQLLSKALKGSKNAKPTKRLGARGTKAAPRPLRGGSTAKRNSASNTISIGGQGCSGWSGGYYWCFVYHKWYDSNWLQMIYHATDQAGVLRWVTCYVDERGFGPWHCYWGLH